MSNQISAKWTAIRAAAFAGRAGTIRLLAVACLCAIPFSAPARADGQVDPLEGKWWGTTGTEKERIDVGFEFRRDASGKLRARLTQPVSNEFDAEIPADVVRDGDQVKVDAFAISFELRGDELSGTYPGPRSRALLRRVRQLPAEQEVADVPRSPEPVWQARLGGQVFASPVVAGGVAYVGGTGGVLNAIETDKGAVKWTFSAGGPIFGAAAISADAIFVVSDSGYLYKLDRGNGRQLWRYPLGDADVPRVLPHPSVFDWDWQAPAPLVSDGVVYVGSGEGSMHAVDAASGERKWRFATNGKLRNSAAVDGDRIVFGSADHFVYSLDRERGSERWRFDTRADVDSAPLVHAGRIYIGNRGAGLYALDAATGTEIWRLFFWGSWVESTPTIADEVLYIGSSDLRRVSAINPENGHVLWRSDVHGWSWGTPLVVGERIYAAAAGGAPYFIRHVASLNTLDRRTGKVLTRWPLPDSGGHQWGIAGSPVRSGDLVLVATIEGSLLAFPLEPTPPGSRPAER